MVRENEIAGNLFYLVRSQCEVRWDGEKDVPIDLRHEALWKAIDNYPGGIQDRWGTFNKVLKAWHEVQKNKED
jgi:hypothetical protein